MATIPADHQVDPVVAPQFTAQWIDPKTGLLSTQAQLFFQQVQQFIKGTARIVPCEQSSAATNTLILSPLDSGPLVKHYADFDGFAFVANATTTGDVDARVETETSGNLGTLNVYKSAGATRATTGDIVAGSFYILFYVDSLNSSAGGFVIK